MIKIPKINIKTIIKSINICDFYILIWLLYFFHWYAEDSEPLLERYTHIFLGLNLIISALCFRKVFISQKLSPIFIAINILLTLYIIYGTLAILIDPAIRHKGHYINNNSYIIGPLRTFLPIYAFYLFTRLGYLTKTKIKIWFIPFFFVAYHLYEENQFIRFGTEVDELYTNNIGYLMAGLLPFVYFFNKNKYVQNAILAILSVLTIQALKRGAILIVLVCLLLYAKDKFTRLRSKSDMVALLLMIIAAWYVVNFTSKTYQTSESFQIRWEKTKKGNDSKRSTLRKELISGFYQDTSFTRAFFGLGANGTLKITTNWAHNDWLEMLIDQGYVGLTAYFFFWITFFFTWRKMKKLPMEYRIIEMVFFSGLIRTIFSMWYNNSNMFITIPIGYCLAQLHIYQTMMDKDVLTVQKSTDKEFSSKLAIIQNGNR